MDKPKSFLQELYEVPSLPKAERREPMVVTIRNLETHAFDAFIITDSWRHDIALVTAQRQYLKLYPETNADDLDAGVGYESLVYEQKTKDYTPEYELHTLQSEY